MNRCIRPLYFLFFVFLTLSITGKGQSGLGGFSYLTDKESKIVYAVNYTPQLIEVTLKIGDPLQQLKLAHNGLEIWVDPKGGKSKKTGIKYPLPSTDLDMPGQDRLPGQNRAPGQNQQDTSVRSVRPLVERQLREKNNMELIGFKSGLNGKHSLDFQSGIVIEIKFGQIDTLEYTAYIPFSAFPNPFDFSRPLSIGIILKGMQQPDFGMIGGGPPGGGPPGEGPPGGSRPGAGFSPPPGGQNGPPDMREMQKMFADNPIWMKIAVRL